MKIYDLDDFDRTGCCVIDLCHDRCACLAGHPIIIIKIIFSCVWGEIARVFLPGAPPLWCVVACLALLFSASLSLSVPQSKVSVKTIMG
ncbi:hypothetical protein LguiB_033125 [Lonicera macranthoides]